MSQLRVERLEGFIPPSPQLQVGRLSAEGDQASTALYRALRLQAEGVVQQPSQGTYRALRLMAEGTIIPYGVYVHISGQWRLCTIYIHQNGAWEAL